MGLYQKCQPLSQLQPAYRSHTQKPRLALDLIFLYNELNSYVLNQKPRFQVLN